MAQIMEIEDLRELISINEIAYHAQFFVAACLMNGMEAAATKLGVDAKTIKNYIKKLEIYTGERILRPSPPGKTMRLSEHGEKLANALIDDFEGAVRKLYLSKNNVVVDKKLLEMAKAMFLPGIPNECARSLAPEAPMEKND